MASGAPIAMKCRAFEPVDKLEILPVVFMVEMRYAYRICDMKCEGNKPMWRPKCRWMDTHFVSS